MNTVYENHVLETKLTELLNSRLEVRSLMRIDDSLTESAGLTKVINRYTYRGSVEELAQGEGNETEGTISFVPETYTVKRYQQTFRYYDMEAMRDPTMIDAALEGMADVMTQQMREEYFRQLHRIRRRHTLSGENLSYADIVEALGDLGREVESDLFLIMGTGARTAIRRDPDFMAAHQGELLYSGQFGTLCGVPTLFSRLVPKDTVIITCRDAVKFFVKREAGLEQSRDIETKQNTVVYKRHGVIALVDDTSSVVLGKAAPTLSASVSRTENTLTLTVSPEAGHKIYTLADADAAMLSENVSGWDLYAGGTIVCPADTQKIAVAETDADGNVLKSVVLSATEE